MTTSAVEVMREFAETAETFVRGHEDARHGGAVCRDERVNLIAFIAHRLGIRGRDLLAVMERAEEYRRIHNEEGN